MRRMGVSIFLVVCYSTMTSFALKSQTYVQMTNSTGAKVCSTDPPSQVLPMFPGGEARCGMECLTSSACPYYQFKSTTLIQCEIYNQFPVNFKISDKCVGFSLASNLCLANNGGCSYDAACIITPGTYTCSCHLGYSGNGFQCADINECVTNNGGCSTNAVCTNNPGSFTCACKTGFTGNGWTCTDINECATNNGGCGSNGCTDTVGSFYCTCPTGCGVNCVITSPYIFSSYSAAFTSMNYPNNYLDSLDCQWLITSSYPYSVVRLNFTAFCTESCCDYVRVYDGSSTSSPLLMSSSGCSGLPGPVTNTQRNMFVRFTTDSSVINTGFSASYILQ